MDPDPVVPPTPCAGWLARWNRRLHFHVGLFLLLFLWLFAFSGLLLNHPTWGFADYWKSRVETNSVHEISTLGAEVRGDLALAREIMRQLGIEGEILWTATRPAADVFDFQVRRPGRYFFLSADLARNRVTLRQSDVNAWGVLKALHAFSGVQLDDPRNRRDWVLTSVWAYSMDGVAAGLIFMVLSSLFMWWRLPSKRVPGVVFLALGTVLCGLFCFGLRWLP